MADAIRMLLKKGMLSDCRWPDKWEIPELSGALIAGREGTA
jgi:hypothetical protein